eukprot:7393709-Lingulodinium_polyedra.AAC.1
MGGSQELLCDCRADDFSTALRMHSVGKTRHRTRQSQTPSSLHFQASAAHGTPREGRRNVARA